MQSKGSITLSFLERKRLELARRRERYAVYDQVLEGVRKDEVEDRRSFYDRLVGGASRDDQEFLYELLLLALDDSPNADITVEETVTDPGKTVQATIPSTHPDAPSPVTARSQSADRDGTPPPSPTTRPRPATVLDVLNDAPDGLEAIEIIARFCEHDHTLEDIARGNCDARAFVERGLREADARKICTYDGRR